MRGKLELVLEDGAHLAEHTVHYLKVVQLDVLRKAHSKVDFDFFDKVCDALHNEVSPFVELSESLYCQPQLLLIAVKLAQLS